MSRIPRRQFLATVTTAAVAAEFRSQAPIGVSRPWLGPEYWANPLQDWRLRNGRMECHVAGGDRNVFLLTREVGGQPRDFTMSVRLGRLEEDRGPLQEGFVGFRLGVKGHFADYRDSAVRGLGLEAGLSADGRLFIGTLSADAPQVAGRLQNVRLQLQAQPAGAGYRVSLEAADPSGKLLGRTERTDVPADWLQGGLALVCSSGPVRETPQPLPAMEPSGGTKPGTQRGGTLRFWFRDWTVAGNAVTAQEDRALGPILWAMHTLSRRVMKLTVQMTPVIPVQPVRLQVRRGAAEPWRTVGRSAIDPLARTATFRVPEWDDTRDAAYRVVYGLHTFEGTVRRDPRDKPKLMIGALTCNNDFGFPHQDVARGVGHWKPDLLLFTGDQIYERVGEYGIQMEPLEPAALDYLRKWYLFGWAYRDLLRDTPCVCLPDDHDVYHGNVWGDAGKKADLPETTGALGTGTTVAPPQRTKAWQDSGGYKMPAAWVNAVQRTQTSHLPDPYDPKPVQQGITVHYTSMLYGGVSFAILEDRKWKSAPRRMIPWADIVNGWAQNPEYDGAKHGDAKGAELLGPRQIEFLEKWAQDWSGDASLKIVVSQTIFANVATLPKPANNDDVTPKLPVLDLGDYPRGEVKVQDHDSNGWPQSPRNAALRAMRKAVAFHIGGDQHLGSSVQYGIDAWNDGPCAVCTPAISNIWPRRWYPPIPGQNRKLGSPEHLGEFLDGFGNKITVHAVANPAQFRAQPEPLHNRAPGYGTIEVDRERRNPDYHQLAPFG